MLGRLEQYVFAHQAGGVADLGDIAADGGNLKIVEVGSPEDDAASSRRRQQAHGNRYAAVKPNPGKAYRLGNGMFQV